MPNIELENKVKEKLDSFKEKSGSKTFSDAINYALLQTEICEFLQENQKFLKENIIHLKKTQELLSKVKKLEMKSK